VRYACSTRPSVGAQDSASSWRAVGGVTWTIRVGGAGDQRRKPSGLVAFEVNSAGRARQRRRGGTFGVLPMGDRLHPDGELYLLTAGRRPSSTIRGGVFRATEVAARVLVGAGLMPAMLKQRARGSSWLVAAVAADDRSRGR